MSTLDAPVQRSLADSAPSELPACITRDNLTSPYFPNTSRGWLSVVCVLCAVFLLTSFNRLNNTDLWGHLSFGRWIVENGSLPTVDPFAASPSDVPVLNYAWLAQTIGYWTKTQFGNEGLVLGHALLVTLTAAAVIYATWRRNVALGWASVAGLAMWLIDLPIVGTIRPQLFGQLAFALMLVACSQLPERRSPLLWIPLLMAAWSNLHSSIAVGLAVLVNFSISTTFDALRDAQWNLSALLRDVRVRRMATAVGLAVLGSCVNPHGPGIWLQSLSFGGREIVGHISEWRRTEPTSLTFLLLASSLLLTAFAYKYSERKWKLYEFVMLAMFALATLMTLRMLAWWAIVWPWIAVPHLASAIGRLLRERGIAPPADEPTAMRTLIAVAVVFATLVIAPPTYALITGNGRGEVPITVTETPVNVADELARRQAAGKFFAPMDWADYMVWRSHGELKPLLYSHVHLTTADVWNDYVAILTADKSALERLRERGVRYVVASRERTPQLMRLLLGEDRAGKGGVRVIYKDQKSLIAELE